VDLLILATSIPNSSLTGISLASLASTIASGSVDPGYFYT
jgi:hypothetical protein